MSSSLEQIISTLRQAIILNRFLAPKRDITQLLTEASISWLDEDDMKAKYKEKPQRLAAILKNKTGFPSTRGRAFASVRQEAPQTSVAPPSISSAASAEQRAGSATLRSE
mgnify:CR=1 FL=1